MDRGCPCAYRPARSIGAMAYTDAAGRWRGGRAATAAHTRAADRLGRLATRASRTAGRPGGIVGGRTVLALDRHALARLARGRTVVLVSGTNGKTTTTAMITGAVAPLGAAATNRTGANMPDGLVAALLNEPAAPVAVLEVDEAYLPLAIRQTRPRAVVLLNLTRDQLDRAGEVRHLETALRDALSAARGTIVVANVDDVLVTSAAAGARAPAVWVAAGAAYGDDAAACPRCGDGIRRAGTDWWCESCPLSRPAPQWRRAGASLTEPAQGEIRLFAGVPGPVNLANAAMAVVTAVTLGVPAAEAAEAAGRVSEVCGRYSTVRLAGRPTRLLLAKNPAGWAAVLDLLADDPGRGLVIAVDGRQADGTDLSWLWDVPFEQLRGRQVVASGARAADLSVRLAYAGVDHDRAEDPVAAVSRCPQPVVDLVSSYSGFAAVSRLAGVR
jgi:lipid II isoglutaminyl synthase (glutamine-hydrolysing)